MTTRAISSQHANDAAELIRLVRARPNDLIDPWPPASEMEMLVDMGARGKGEPCHPRIALDGDTVVGYGAIDFSPDMRQAQMVGPVVHPAHRKKGHGRELLADLLDRARQANQKFLKAAIGVDNGAGKVLLEGSGFKPKETHTCLRLGRPEKITPIVADGIELGRVDADMSDEYFAFTSKLVPRRDRQTRNLLKADNYAAIFAYKDGSPVACVEVDMRFGDSASVENLDAPPSLLHQGLGNALLMEAARIAFENEHVKSLDLLMAGTSQDRVDALVKNGFEVRHRIDTFELRL